MTKENVELIMQKIKHNLPKDTLFGFKKKLEDIPDKYVDEILYLSLKKSWLTLLFSILLGGLGVDRFYLGDIGLGIAKLIFSVISRLVFLVPVIGFLFSISTAIWLITDIFLTLKKAKENNRYNLNALINKINREIQLNEEKKNEFTDKKEEKPTNSYLIENEKPKQIVSENKSKTPITNREAKQYLIDFLEKMTLKGTVEDVEVGSKMTIKINIANVNCLIEILVRSKDNVLTSALNFGKIYQNDETAKFICDFNFKYEIAEEEQVFKLKCLKDADSEVETLKLIGANYFKDGNDLNDKIYNCVEKITAIDDKDLTDICNLISGDKK